MECRGANPRNCMHDELKARLAEAEHLILRMAGEDYQRARFYVEKYDLTGERAAVSADAAIRCPCNCALPDPGKACAGCGRINEAPKDAKNG